MKKIMKSYIGDRTFYKMVLAIVMPIIIQNSITNFVSLLDNMMVGRLGTEPMSGVAVANQLFFVFNLTVFGAVSGAGIFCAQFHGAGNIEGVRQSFRFKLYLCSGIVLFVTVLLWFKGQSIIMLFLNETSDPERVKLTLDYGVSYLHVMLIGLIPFALVQSYASTLRESGETKIPMVASVTAVVVNLIFNYLLIFGKMGFPALGVRGAAIATVFSRFVELFVVVSYTHRHKDRYLFADHLYANWKLPPKLLKQMALCALPLLANELLWSGAQSVLTQTYSLRGLDVVAALNITMTIINFVTAAYLSMGSAAAIIIGQALGANDIERAKDYVRKIQAFGVMVALGTAIIVFAVSPQIPELYSTTFAVKRLATKLIRIFCIMMPVISYSNCCYFIIRSGGKTGVTFLFDCVFVWLITIPVAMLLIRGSDMRMQNAFLCVQSCEFIKCIIGYILLKKGIWIQNIVGGGVNA